MTKKNRDSSGYFGVVVILMAVIWGLTSLWYWALHGMDEKIGTATGMTSFALFMVGFIMCMNAWET